MRLAVEGSFDPAAVADGVKRRIAAAAALPDFEALTGAIAEAREKVREIFLQVLRANAP
jgi:hypothetical protein